jgi:hypothetical protein
MTRQARSTYRLQIAERSPLQEAAGNVGDLRQLGVDWLYVRPLLAAEAGSDHGDDVDHHRSVEPTPAATSRPWPRRPAGRMCCSKGSSRARKQLPKPLGDGRHHRLRLADIDRVLVDPADKARSGENTSTLPPRRLKAASKSSPAWEGPQRTSPTHTHLRPSRRPNSTGPGQRGDITVAINLAAAIRTLRVCGDVMGVEASSSRSSGSGR